MPVVPSKIWGQCLQKGLQRARKIYQIPHPLLDSKPLASAIWKMLFGGHQSIDNWILPDKNF